MDSSGRLFIVSTPIGNRQDITLRALQTLESVGLIACEDTRKTGRLIKGYGISNRLTAFHEYNEKQKTPVLIKKLGEGVSIALVSNAGTPLISDPGHRLAEAATRVGIPVIPIPGVSAAITALSVSGLPTDAFTFMGFPPRKNLKLEKFLLEMAGENRTLIFYESPVRIEALLKKMLEIFGDRRCMLAREMTKLYEEFLHGNISSLLEKIKTHKETRGEFTLVVAGAGRPGPVSKEAIHKRILEAFNGSETGISEISRRLASELGVSRREVYEESLRLFRKKGKTD
jgi:16S rRNA (cytidine1402-2'-O)-methyltransferase